MEINLEQSFFKFGRISVVLINLTMYLIDHFRNYMYYKPASYYFLDLRSNAIGCQIHVNDG